METTQPFLFIAAVAAINARTVATNLWFATHMYVS